MRTRTVFICILLSAVCLPGVSQVLDTMYFDRDWQQTIASGSHYYRIVSADTAGDLLLYVEDYYPGGQIQMTGTYRSIRPDNKHGHFVYYYEDGRKQMECTYRDNLLHGSLREWYPSGQEESLQEFSDGMLNGEFISWREDGGYKLKARYHRGEKHGNFRSFYPNGQMVRDDYYENGELLEGHCYSPTGKPVEYFPYIVMPRFPGGYAALRRFIDKETVCPKEARQMGIEGSVIVRFTVDESGSVKNPEVVNGDRAFFNKEALRVVGKFPRWVPGELDGVPSPLQVSVPFYFNPFK